MRGRDQEMVQSYLDDLLAEVPPAEMRTVQPLPVRTAVAPPLQEQVQSLEKVKRQQLQALLDSQPVSVAAPVQAPVAPVKLPVAEVPAPVVHSAPASQPALEIVPVLDDTPAGDPTLPDPKSRAADAVSPLLQWCANGRPVWAQQNFDVLLFQVSGLTLAVPLIALGHIHPLTDELTPIFGQADWFMGLQPTSAGRIRAVNTALLVMPERYDPAFVQSARYVVSIAGLDWGLAVDQVQQPARLAPEDVTWRSERSKRPWLAGTVKTAMCALLDLPQMGRILESQDRKRAH